jgi:hypothetical protein
MARLGEERATYCKLMTQNESAHVAGGKTVVLRPIKNRFKLERTTGSYFSRDAWIFLLIFLPFLSRSRRIWRSNARQK